MPLTSSFRGRYSAPRRRRCPNGHLLLAELQTVRPANAEMLWSSRSWPARSDCPLRSRGDVPPALWRLTARASSAPLTWRCFAAQGAAPQSGEVRSATRRCSGEETEIAPTDLSAPLPAGQRLERHATTSSAWVPPWSGCSDASDNRHLWDFSGTFSSVRGTSEGLSAAQSGKRVKGRKGTPMQVRGPFQGEVPGRGGRVSLYGGYWLTAVRLRQTPITGDLRGHHANVQVLAKPQLNEGMIQRRELLCPRSTVAPQHPLRQPVRALPEFHGLTKPRLLRIMTCIDASHPGDRRCTTRSRPRMKPCS